MNLRTTLFIMGAILCACGGKKALSEFPMEKRYWTSEDYDEVIRKIEFKTPKGADFPKFQNPETAPVIEKLTDSQNFLVLLTDDQLGLSHRNDLASSFFEEYRDMANVYYVTDRQDKFVYGMELMAIQKFGLELQIHYFKLGNENIIKNADDPNDLEVRRILSSNVNTVFKNFNNYLDFVNKESALNENELKAYCEGIDTYFPRLFKTFSQGNFDITKKKADLMLKKAQNEQLITSLRQLIEHIDLIQSSTDNS